MGWHDRKRTIREMENDLIEIEIDISRLQDDIRGLKFINMFTLTNAQCRARFLAETNRPAPVTDWDTICAFSGNEGHGICSTDSGGALVFESRIIGITSWGGGFQGRCGPGVPDGFTRISNYLPWIARATTQFP